MSFQQGLSGLNASAKNLDVIGNNVANANTTGFKQGVAAFGDVYASWFGGGAGSQIGIGTQFTGVAQQFSQGSITTTSSPLDVAVNGQGFYRMSNNGAISYTRDGSFSLDKNGAIVPGVLTNLQLSSTDILAKATSTASVGANLASTDPILPTSAFVATNPGTYNYSTASSCYDSLGKAHTVSFYFNKTAANAWDANVYVDGVAANGSGVSNLSFNSSGSFLSATNAVKTATLSNGAAPLSITVDYSAMTQFGSSSGINSLSQNGYAAGQLSGYSIGDDGTILGRYSNGQSSKLGQIALSSFANPQGLAPTGDSMWVETSNSGVALTGTPGSASLGALQAFAKEESNVDLTAELVNMISAQRIYQANAQSIKTEDALMQTLVNLK